MAAPQSRECKRSKEGGESKRSEFLRSRACGTAKCLFQCVFLFIGTPHANDISNVEPKILKNALNARDGMRTCKESSNHEALRAGVAPPCAPPPGNVQEISEIAAAWLGLSAPLRAAVLAIVRSVQSVQEVRP